MTEKKGFKFEKSTVKLIASAVLLALGFILCWLWFGVVHGNAFGMLAIIVLAGGGFLTIRYFKQWREFGGVEVPIDVGQDKSKKTPQYNSLSIYPHKVVFEDVVKPEGQKWRCHNDGKNYFVNIWDVDDNKLKPFVLPDQQYRDPERFAQQTLELPAHRRLYRKRQKLLEQLAPGFMVLAIIVFWIVIITT